MERHAPQVYVENVKGNVYHVPLSLTYTHQGKEKILDIDAGPLKSIGSLSDIKEGTALVFSGRDEALTAIPLSVTREHLVQEFVKLKGSSADVLIVTISSSGLRAPYTLTATYKLQQPENVKQRIEAAKKNVLTLFPRIRYLKLESVLSEDAIVKAKSWQDVLVPEGLVMKATTAEDVFRYILEIPEPLYTQEQVKQAFRDRLAQWHPDKVQPEDKAFVNRVVILLRAAYEGLLKAIAEKTGTSDFQSEREERVYRGWLLQFPEDPR